MIKYISTTNFIPEQKTVKLIGVVNGISVFSLKPDDPLNNYTKQCDDAREDALQKMIADAEGTSANAVIVVHYNTTALGGKDSLVQIHCYGTAVMVD